MGMRFSLSQFTPITTERRIVVQVTENGQMWNTARYHILHYESTGNGRPLTIDL